MKTEPSGREFRISQTIYRWLLLAYPRGHRAEYGAAMTQLFRDQCRDAWDASRTWGLVKLWLRVLPDLVRTSILERLAALKERKSMTEKLASLFSFRTPPPATFFRVFVLVFLTVFTASVAITFILPESYASTARIRVEMVQENQPAYDPDFISEALSTLDSQLVLNPVATNLNLGALWGKKYSNGSAFKTPDVVALLRSRLKLAVVKNSKLIAITAYSDDKNEAARIANAVAESYQDYRVQNRKEITDKTMQALREQYDEQGNQIQEKQAELDALQKKFDLPDNVEGLAAALVNTETSLQNMKGQFSRLRVLDHEQKRNVAAGIVSDTELAALIRKLHDAEQQFVTLTNDFAVTNLAVVRVSSLLEVLNRQIDERVTGIMTGLENQLAATQAAADGLAAKIQKAKPVPETQPYWDTKQNLEQLNESHMGLFAKMEAQKLSAELPKMPSVQITDPAEPGRAPVKPNKPLNIFLGAIMGFFVAAAVGTFFVFLSVLAGKRMQKTAGA